MKARSGLPTRETPPKRRTPKKSADQVGAVNHHALVRAANAGDPTGRVDPPGSVSSIRSYYRIYSQLQRAELSLGNQIGSIQRIIRRGHHRYESQTIVAETDKGGKVHVCADDQIENDLLAQFAVAPLEYAKAFIHAENKPHEKKLLELSAQLPVSEWVKTIRGAGQINLAKIIAETGNLSQYDNPAKVWKRMGLAVIRGRAQRRVSGKASRGKTKEEAIQEAIEQGFSPHRRAIMHVLGECLVKGNKDGYRELYLERKKLEFDKLADVKKGRKGWAHKRALRYIEKRFLLELWRAWRTATGTNSAQEEAVA